MQSSGRQLAVRYRRAGKKDKGRLLDELVALTGYSRWYAVGLLGSPIENTPAQPKRRAARVRERLIES